jgi:hypothetical protein
MTDDTTSRPSAVGDAPDGSPAWEVPEIVAVAVLIAFFATVIGALATGIDVSMATSPPFFDPMESVWNSIQFGTTWAEPVLAIILLGVVGLCWWRVAAWSEVRGADANNHSTALGHIQRARRISLWALSSLIITAVGAIAGIIALIGFNIPSHPGRIVWSRVFGAAAGVLADIVIVVAGALVLKRLVREGSE